MRLTPHERERLMIHVAADVARRRKARKTPLNYPEAVALITAYVLEEARDGQKSVADLMHPLPSSVIERADLMPGVAEMLSGIQVEATFPDGTKMVSIRHPLPPMAVQPVPEAISQAVPPPVHPGKVEHPAGAGPVVFNQHLQGAVVTVTVTNTDDRPIQVGSHYHFYEVNPLLTIDPDRDDAYGRRLNIPSGSSVRFEPNDTLQVELVPIEGDRIVMGLRGEVGGKL
ncbi:urease subunit gamma [Actinomadura sp. KC345]|uniref:urease subunit gamma n=1 Tax=Actinomadura sp. KC345 TaxID=2530371 RepID=UPI001051210D|nr:urease subunit gamma [Actinomadura sp. KC345]TDC50518.1 urease subunit gamma [Actinomadura sp. KC345]